MMTAEQIALWRKAADDGNLYARFVLGTLYATGNGVPADPVEAKKWFESAAGKTDIAKDTFLGSMYAQGRIIPSDDAEAFAWIEKDAMNGFAEAQIMLGRRCYYNGCGVAKDEVKAVKWFRKAAQQGNDRAQFYLGWHYANGRGVPQDEVEAVNWYRKSAQQGHADAQLNLGWCYDNGLGVKKDEAEAAKLYRKAAEQGQAAAQFFLGWDYANGCGVAKDEVEAVNWYRKAAEQGHVKAQFNLGWNYANGRGVAKDEAEAVNWYRKAAEQRNADAQYSLGVCYVKGSGVEKDEAEAVKLFRKAAEQGDAWAQNYLGWCYANGCGVAKEEVNASKWYLKAALQGNESAQKTLGIDATQKNLLEAVRRYGREIALDERRCEAVLKDLCGGDACRREVHLLMCAVRSGAVGQLLADGNSVPQAVLEARLIKRLRDDFGVSEELAGWSVKSWIIALGLKVPSNDAESRCQVDLATVNEYLVVDLSAGPTASKYPVTTLSAVPTGGWTDEYKTTKMVFRRIPAGTFTMGSPTDELERSDNETQHQVTLTQPFYIGVFEVTQKQWERVMGTWPSRLDNPNFRDSRPVEKVSYNAIRGSSVGVGWPANNNVDTDSFMGRLRARTGKDFDLPTEAQWEYAGRAGTTTALNSGYNLTNDRSDAHMSELGRCWGNNVEIGKTAKVGSYQPNAWGLYDIHGNVMEWCLDWYGTYPGTVSNPKGPALASARVARGGGWNNGPTACRVTYRYNNSPSCAFDFIGFRVVLPTGQ